MSLLTNLISYWKLDGNSTDSVGSNNGTDTAINYGTIAFDAKADLAINSWSHTCSGSNRILFVFVNGENDGSDNVTGVTYNSVGMTQIGKVRMSDNSRYIYLYYLIAPATGTNTVSITRSAGTAYGVSTSYTGAKQSGVPDASVTYAATGTSLTGTVTTIATSCWLVGCVYFNSSGGGTMSGGTGTTIRVNPGAGYPEGMGDSNASIQPAGSASLIFNITGASVGGAVIVASFEPASLNSGKINQGAGFNGTTSNIQCMHSGNASMQFSTSGWLKTTQNPVGTYPNIIGSLYGGGYITIFTNSGGYIGANVTDNGSHVLINAVSSSAYNDGNWHFCVLTVSGSGTTYTATLYIDGTSVTTNTSSSISGNFTTTSFIIGDGLYSGSIDEVGIWSRALTSTEVSQLYNFNNGLPYPLSYNSGNIFLTF